MAPASILRMHPNMTVYLDEDSATLLDRTLYLGSIPMSEPFFYAALFALLFFTVRFAETSGWLALAGAGIAACALVRKIWAKHFGSCAGRTLLGGI